jgi:hypothetical protein
MSTTTGKWASRTFPYVFVQHTTHKPYFLSLKRLRTTPPRHFEHLSDSSPVTLWAPMKSPPSNNDNMSSATHTTHQPSPDLQLVPEHKISKLAQATQAPDPNFPQHRQKKAVQTFTSTDRSGQVMMVQSLAVAYLSSKIDQQTFATLRANVSTILKPLLHPLRRCLRPTAGHAQPRPCIVLSHQRKAHTSKAKDASSSSTNRLGIQAPQPAPKETLPLR